jgi:hypothetical protein
VEQRQAAVRQSERQQQLQTAQRQREHQLQSAQRQRSAPRAVERRLSGERQQQLITLQHQRTRSYDHRLQRAHVEARERSLLLQRQRRHSAYRYQEQYLQRLRQQRYELQRYDDAYYRRDPYFYTAPSYRYSRGGDWYETNHYGAELLRRAVELGYAEGYRSAQADRYDGWRSDCHNSYGYLDASYGYGGLYVDHHEYQHYFREGFQRGYEDGYGNHYRYGQRHGDRLTILAEVLLGILQLHALG